MCLIGHQPTLVLMHIAHYRCLIYRCLKNDCDMRHTTLRNATNLKDLTMATLRTSTTSTRGRTLYGNRYASMEQSKGTFELRNLEEYLFRVSKLQGITEKKIVLRVGKLSRRTGNIRSTAAHLSNCMSAVMGPGNTVAPGRILNTFGGFFC